MSIVNNTQLDEYKKEAAKFAAYLLRRGLPDVAVLLQEECERIEATLTYLDIAERQEKKSA